MQGAADWELEPLIEALAGRVEERAHRWVCWRGTVGAHEVVVERTDWGPVNAVAATVAAIQAFRPDAIISQGMAGAHDPDLNIGDIVVAERTVDLSAYKTAPAGLGEGVQASRRTPLSHRLRIRDGLLKEFPAFAGDPRLIEAFGSASNPHGRVVRGCAGSAYQYNRELDLISELRRLYGTACEDMESAFSAGAAMLWDIPFVAVRMISNSEWTSATLDKRAGQWCAGFVRDVILRGLSPSA